MYKYRWGKKEKGNNQYVLNLPFRNINCMDEIPDVIKIRL